MDVFILVVLAVSSDFFLFLIIDFFFVTHISHYSCITSACFSRNEFICWYDQNAVDDKGCLYECIPYIHFPGYGHGNLDETIHSV